MDDFMLVRFALDNVRVPEIAATAEKALDRIIQGRAVVDPDGPDGRAYERARRRDGATQLGRREPARGSRLVAEVSRGAVGQADATRVDIFDKEVPASRPPRASFISGPTLRPADCSCPSALNN